MGEAGRRGNAPRLGGNGVARPSPALDGGRAGQGRQRHPAGARAGANPARRPQSRPSTPSVRRQSRIGLPGRSASGSSASGKSW